MRIRLPCLLLLLALPLLSSAEEGGGEGSGWHRLVGILQYLQADYPAAVGVGAVLFLFGRHLLSGANRELMVGAAALVPLPLFTVEVLGVYPDAVSLLPQLALAPLLWLGVRRWSRPEQLAGASSQG